MSQPVILEIAHQLPCSPQSVEAVLSLFSEGATVPFIARYRKEQTGNLDEVAILAIRDLNAKILERDERRQTILRSLKDHPQWSPELEEKILRAKTLSEIEDIYLPYRPKRKTKGSIALEKGLEPLALEILANREPDLETLKKNVNPEKNVFEPAEALSGAQDLAAERISEIPELRSRLREEVLVKSHLVSKKARGVEIEEDYKPLMDKTEAWTKIPSHRLLAFLRGRDQGQLSLKMEYPEESVLVFMAKQFQLPVKALKPSLLLSMKDAWDRLIGPSLENEVFQHYKTAADLVAIKIFSENLRKLLLSSPLGQKSLLALDPGLRTGCKWVALNAQGDLLEHGVIYPLVPYQKTDEAAKILRVQVEKHKIEAIAVGNGTGGREALSFVESLKLPVQGVYPVNESGASVYSASEVARREFPQHDLTVRGAVSIGRRLMDPLAELVKIDPKSIGVGQYQHDVDQKALKKSLDDVVVSCVNRVGVDVNTSSLELLTYVAGLNSKIAENIISLRQTQGPFDSRLSLKKVKGLGPKTFEQCAGFLRIRQGKNPLDNTGVHPERYGVVEKIAAALQVPVKDLVNKPLTKLKMEDFSDGSFGKETWEDILKELSTPGLDPRPPLENVHFDPEVKEISDLKPGQVLQGQVTNVTAFGAFVDIGVHQDGLVHISQLADHFVQDPLTVVQPGKIIRVKVLDVDVQRKRISLSLREAGSPK